MRFLSLGEAEQQLRLEIDEAVALIERVREQECSASKLQKAGARLDALRAAAGRNSAQPIDDDDLKSSSAIPARPVEISGARPATKSDSAYYLTMSSTHAGVCLTVAGRCRLHRDALLLGTPRLKLKQPESRRKLQGVARVGNMAESAGQICHLAYLSAQPSSWCLRNEHVFPCLLLRRDLG